MPSDIMDQRHMPSFYKASVPSTCFSEEMWFPFEKQVGFWKMTGVPDRHGSEGMSSMSGGRAVSLSTLEKFRPVERNFVDRLECSDSLFKGQRRNIPPNAEHQLFGAERTVNCLRASGHDVASLSKLHGQPASFSVEAKKTTTNGGRYMSGLSSNSLSDIFNNKLRLSGDVFVGQSVNSTQSNVMEDGAFESLEEIEAQTIGDLLPDDDELLSGAIYGLGYVPHSNMADVEDDLFCSVGGMELESDDNFGCKNACEYGYGGSFNGQEMVLDNFRVSNIPHGQQSTRTIFVKNINGDIEDMELRVLFEQYGDIQTLLTSFKRHGFVMVSYYDIRAAENAVKVLRSKLMRGQMLDIQFCNSQDNPSEKDVNEGVLLVTSLESSISNDDLLHMFGRFGEIKEVCEIPHQHHYKLVEFYDARAAETALSALNGCDIAGNRIIVEPFGQRVPRISSMKHLAADLEGEESSRYFVPPGLTMFQPNPSVGLHNGAKQGMRTAFEMQNSLSMESKFCEISFSKPNSSSSARAATVGSHGMESGNSEFGRSLGQTNFGFYNMSTFPEFREGVMSDISFNSPSTMSAMANNVSSALANGSNNRNTQRVGSVGRGSPSFDRNKAAFTVSGNGSCPLLGHEYIWNNSNGYRNHSNSLMWQNLSPFMNNIRAQAPQVHGLPGGLSHLSNSVLSAHQHIDSSPPVDPLLWDGRRAFSSDATPFHPSSIGNPSIASAHLGVPSPQQRSQMFRGRSNANTRLGSHDASSDRIRSRKNDSSASQADNRKQFELDVDHIIRGEDSRTTLMIKNIPNKYTSKMLLATIDEQHKGTYDFIYLPIDFKNKCNVGYAFINMTDPKHIISFYQSFNGKKWEKFNSEKVAYLAYARIQGKAALVAHFQNSSLMNEDKRCRPILFHSDGPSAGDQEPFPLGVNIRYRRSRTNTENHQGSPSGSSSGEESSNATASSPGSTKERLD